MTGRARASLEVLPAAALTLLFVPIAMSYPQLMDWTPLLDCSPRGILGYVPHLIDYGRFVLRSLTNGVLLGLNSALGWQNVACVPEAMSNFAATLGSGLQLVPATLLALIAFRWRWLGIHGRAAA